VCRDWSRPHSSLLQIISSSMVAFAGARFGLKYVHKCHSTLDFNDKDMEFDVTTIQQIFPEAVMPIDQRELKLGDVVHNLCSSCIQEYETNQSFLGEQRAHHCLGMPQMQNVHEDVIRVEEFDENSDNNMPHVVMKSAIIDAEGRIVNPALGSVLPLVKNRLNHAAMDWYAKSHIPAHDPKSGAVIYLDANLSVPIPFQLYLQNISPQATHVSILSGPKCVNGKLGEKSCIAYGEELEIYLKRHYNDAGVKVSFELVSSTAAAYARMILAHTLVCPPGTVSCLLPAIAKQKTAIVMEIPQEVSTYHWFTHFGKAAKNVKVLELTQNQLSMSDNEQIAVEQQFVGFNPKEVTGNPPAKKKSPAPPEVKSLPDLGEITMQMNTAATAAEKTKESTEPKAPADGYLLIDNQSKAKQSEADTKYVSSGSLFDRTTDEEKMVEADKKGEEKKKINIDMEISKGASKDSEQGSEGKKIPNFDYSALFGDN